MVGTNQALVHPGSHKARVSELEFAPTSPTLGWILVLLLRHSQHFEYLKESYTVQNSLDLKLPLWPSDHPIQNEELSPSREE